MKFQYGKQAWKTLRRGEESCYLMTNGLGGFSSLSLAGSCSRNDQAVLMACLKAPNHRYNMIHRIAERLTVGEQPFCLSSQEFVQEESREEGFFWQEGFAFADYPVWTYRVRGVEVTRTIVLAQGENTVGVRYEIRNGSGKKAALAVTPQLEFVPKGSILPREADFSFLLESQDGEVASAVISSSGLTLHLRTNGAVSELPLQLCEGLFYADDEKDGRPFVGRTAVNHRVGMEVLPGQRAVLELVYGTEPVEAGVGELIRQVCRYRGELAERAGFRNGTAQSLAVGANQFLSRRESTEGWTILAGFPFFEDWGRDTMIAFTGCCLATGQWEAAKSILRTFARYGRKGLLPNLFPEGGEEPGYNTVDAALLFILAVWEYVRRTEDIALAGELFPVMEEIVFWYERGTDFGIRMDGDGLLTAGSGLDQVTWMDVRIGEILPTPRHGKPVEINAYWYNALRVMEWLCGRVTGRDSSEKRAEIPAKTASDYGAMADRVQESFERSFWNEKAGCLKDVLCGGPAEDQIRCNQIWAVSLPFSLLSPERERRVVEVVYEKLYTPLGLRTLDPADAEYHGFYGGPQKERDMAYHQGTVWVFPLGAFYLAYLKVHGYTRESRETVTRWLELLEPALREGCIGQLPEIYDGDNPILSKGCFAQAWSVGEILRVYDALREDCPGEQTE